LSRDALPYLGQRSRAFPLDVMPAVRLRRAIPGAFAAYTAGAGVV